MTLRGEVASDDERAQALILARTTEGVERVEDALTVNISLGVPATSAATPATPATPAEPAPAAEAASAAQTQDATLATQIESKLGADGQLKAATIEVTAKDGVVLLEGTAPTVAVKQRALSVARATQGVLQVVDRIKIGGKR